MKLFFTLTTVALFMSTASYAEELCDPLIHKECICERIPVMSKDGKRVLYYYYNNIELCLLPNSSDSKRIVKHDNDDDSVSNSDDENDDVSNGDESEDSVNDDSNDDVSQSNSEDRNSDDSNGDNSEDRSEDKNDD